MSTLPPPGSGDDPGCHGRGRMTRVTASRRCPVCNRPDWCLVAPDGAAAAICSRTESPRRCGDAGWLHRLVRPEPRPRSEPRARHATRVDWPAEARRYAAALTPAVRDQLAADLGVPADTLAVLPLLGFRDEGGGRSTSSRRRPRPGPSLA